MAAAMKWVDQGKSIQYTKANYAIHLYKELLDTSMYGLADV